MKKVTGALAAFLYGTSSLYAATLLPNGQQQFIDANGKPYANGKVYFYSNFPTCSILKNTYQNEAGTVLNTNPVTLSAAGTATIFGTGAYCQVLKDQLGNTVWTKYTSDTSSASNLGWGGTSGGTANAQTVSVSSFANVNGQTFYFVAGASNTSALTLSVNGGTPLAVVRPTPTGVLSLAGGEVIAGNVIGVTYVSSTGQLQLATNNTQIGYPGEVRTFAMASCPSGWLYANGSSVSATTYSNLFAAIGTTWGTSAGNVVLPDFRNQFMRGDGSSAVGTFQANDLKSHTHTATSVVTDLGHTHSYDKATAGTTSVQLVGAFVSTPTVAGSSTGSSPTGVTVSTTNANTGGTETRPDNYRVRFCIKY
jgi:microcystin-dependent protein